MSFSSTPRVARKMLDTFDGEKPILRASCRLSNPAASTARRNANPSSRDRMVGSLSPMGQR